MGKYLFPDLTPELAAIVSTHGYYEIQKRESFNSYASGIGPVYKTNPDGSKDRCPDPVVVHSGVVSELGITHENDDIYFDGADAEDDGREVIRQKLLAYLAVHIDGADDAP
jgi:hypothetical protein